MTHERQLSPGHFNIKNAGAEKKGSVPPHNYVDGIHACAAAVKQRRPKKRVCMRRPVDGTAKGGPGRDGAAEGGWGQAKVERD